jgi:hypothetical protein
MFAGVAKTAVRGSMSGVIRAQAKRPIFGLFREEKLLDDSQHQAGRRKVELDSIADNQVRARRDDDFSY